LALKQAVVELLFPALAKEAEERLLREAREWMAWQYGEALWRRVAQVRFCR
jgi:hypothetical protein